MKARDVMTAEVVAVPPEMPAAEIARLLLDKRISAVPVVDGEGMPIGIVSEGDLIGRSETDREARRDWWLALLADANPPKDDFLRRWRAGARLREPRRAFPASRPRTGSGQAG
jgi:CBS domain containing-hemolysin-like protein